jgi:heterodisulfide reductase subunit A
VSCQLRAGFPRSRYFSFMGANPVRKKMNRIGVYICECGPNIRDAVDVDSLVAFSGTLPGVALSRRHGLLCSAEGQALIAMEIAAETLTHVVVAGCSPKEHERTFQRVIQSAGLNPFLLQVAAIREQCAWVTPDRTAATEKAKTLIRAAVRRVAFSAALVEGEIPCCADLLVAGAGISGISAALAAAREDRRVYLVETLPCIGGKVARFETVFPGGECATCLLDPLMDAALHHDHITVMTLSQIEDVRGFLGNFQVRVRRRAGFVSPDACLGCGACVEACPVEVPNAFNEGLNTRKAIYIPYPGALPHIACVDSTACLHFSGGVCSACRDACPFGAIDLEESDLFEELLVGGILLATGFDHSDIRPLLRYGYGIIPHVYTSMEFERLASATGPTDGELVLKSGAIPRHIALIHCAGSRTAAFKTYCSAVCCRYMLKFAVLAAQKLPEVSIRVYFSDWCLPGKDAHDLLITVIGQERIQLCRMAAPDSIEIRQKDDAIGIRWKDSQHRMQDGICDMVVLAPALTGAESAAYLSGRLDVPMDADGFFMAEHPAKAPVSTLREGVWIAGCARGPCSMADAVCQGQAAAGMMLSRLVPGKPILLPAWVSEVNPAMCSGCRICLGVCPYGAISFEASRAVIREALCRGCGACAASCPGSAIDARQFTDRQLTEEITGLLNRPGSEKFFSKAEEGLSEGRTHGLNYESQPFEPVSGHKPGKNGP